MPPGIEDDDYDSEGDMLILEELLSNYSLSLLENESFHFDIPSSPRPPVKPPYDDEIEPNSRILTVKVVSDIFEYYVPVPRLLPTQPTLASKQKKSPHLLSHQGLKTFQLPSESPMIYEGNNPILDIDSLLDEFAGELILLKSISLGIDEADCDPKEEIHLIKKFLYDNSSPRPVKEFIFENSDAAIESFSPSLILVEDSDSPRYEINLSLTPDDSMPPGIEDDDYDSEGDMLILEELLS
nr:hypothetical protein [Tanacetum cinerariifolium]